jgi:hypothetical protein
MLSVMGSRAGGAYRDSRDHFSVLSAARIDVENSEEITLLAISIARPYKQKTAAGGLWLRTSCPSVAGTEDKSENEVSATMHRSWQEGERAA